MSIFSLNSLQKELEDLKCQVIVVACGPEEGAHDWIEGTKCKYPFLLDPERKVNCIKGVVLECQY